MRFNVRATSFVAPSTVALAALALLALALLALPSCDNPACVFGGTCSDSGSGGAIGTQPASIPARGEIVRNEAPTLERVLPTGNSADPGTPVAVQFSESLSPSGLNTAFEMSPTGGLGVPVLFQGASLIGDGRLVVLLPAQPLELGESYELRLRQSAVIFDRTGQEYVPPTSRVLGSFGVAASEPTTPTVLTTYPADGTLQQSTSSEIVVLFSRAVVGATVNGSSFDVLENGQQPVPDASPQALSLAGIATDTRVFRWRRVDDQGLPVPFASSAQIEVVLSPVGNKIEDADGADVPALTSEFALQAFQAPDFAVLNSVPTDAIGTEQLDGDAVDDLLVHVQLLDAASGDFVGFFLFGDEPGDEQPPRRIALFREVAVTGAVTSIELNASQVDLTTSTSPVTGRLRDGEVAMALRVRRGTQVSPVVLLDVDMDENGAQHAMLDTVAPVVLGLSASGTSFSPFRSDARDLVIVGRASEAPRAALVRAFTLPDETTNGSSAQPDVLGAQANGLFLAAPVPLGILASGTVPFEVTVFDRALNASAAVMGDWQQLGVAARAGASSFTLLNVEVLNAVTLDAVVGASVVVHQRNAGAVTPAASGTTLTGGLAALTLPAAAETIVTVEAAGFDLFTFDGVPTERMSIPLTPSPASSANVVGVVATEDLDLTLFERRVSDTRSTSADDTLFTVNVCAVDSVDQRLECPFGPIAVRARELGAETMLATLPGTFAGSTSLRAFGLTLPLAPITPATTQQNVVETGTLLDDPLLPAEERALDMAPFSVSTLNWGRLSGPPKVRIEGLTPGLARGLVVGTGAAFGAGGGGLQAVIAAIPGAVDGEDDDGAGSVDELGRLVVQGVVGADLRARVLLADAAGNRGGVRPRFSALGGTPTFTAPAPPTFAAPASTLNPSGAALDVEFVDVIGDQGGTFGLHSLSLTDSAGRRWVVWTLDRPDAAGPNVTVSLPFLGTGPAFPLAAGPLAARIQSFGLRADLELSSTLFLWSDIEREFERDARSAPLTLTPP